MRTINLLRSLLVVFALAFAGVVVWSLQDRSAKEGAKAPDFTVHTDTGKAVTPTAFGGRVLVLNFWATWCSPCVEEIPSLSQFQRQFANSGVVVLAVSVDKNANKYKSFLDHVKVSFATTRDPNADVSGAYGTFRFPESYIIKDGVVVRKIANQADWTSDEMTQYIRGLL